MDTPVSGGMPVRVRTLPSWLITHVASTTRRAVGEALHEADAREYHYLVLAVLDEFGPASPADLERRTNINLSDIVATIGTLSRKRYVKRTPAPLDKRRTILTLTPAGQRHLHHLDEVLDAVQEKVLAPLMSAEREQLNRLLGKLYACRNGRTAER